MALEKHTANRFAALLLCFLFAAFRLTAQVTVEARLDTANILIGEQVQISVKCTAGAKQNIIFPVYQPQQEITPGVEFIGYGKADTTSVGGGKQIQITRRYTITSFDSAVYKIPPFEVKVDGKAYKNSNALGLKVNTVAVDTVHVENFRGPHDVVDQPFEWSWALTLSVVGCILALIAAIALAVRLADPRLITRKRIIYPPTPAHVTAIGNIQNIKRNPAADSKKYYMDLTETLRIYIESRFGFSAKEMTTNEIVEKLCATGNEGALAELKDVLLTADLVKFAKHTPTLPEQDRSLVQALDYVQATQLKPEELPKPKVEVVSLSTKKQIAWRNVMRTAMWLLFIGSLVWWAYNIYTLYCCFG